MNYVKSHALGMLITRRPFPSMLYRHHRTSQRWSTAITGTPNVWLSTYIQCKVYVGAFKHWHIWYSLHFQFSMYSKILATPLIIVKLAMFHAENRVSIQKFNYCFANCLPILDISAWHISPMWTYLTLLASKVVRFGRK